MLVLGAQALHPLLAVPGHLTPCPGCGHLAEAMCFLLPLLLGAPAGHPDLKSSASTGYKGRFWISTNSARKLTAEWP